jgi:hypothetical protein
MRKVCLKRLSHGALTLLLENYRQHLLNETPALGLGDLVRVLDGACYELFQALFLILALAPFERVSPKDKLNAVKQRWNRKWNRWIKLGEILVYKLRVILRLQDFL